MNNNNIKKGFNSGVLLIAIGVVGLFFTLSDIPVVFSLMWKFWPVLLLIIGVLFLPVKSLIKIIFLSVTIIVACIIYAVEVKDYTHSYSYDNYNDNSYDNIGDDVNTQLFSEPYSHDVDYAEVNVEYGAGKMFMKKPCEDLIESCNGSNVLRQTFEVRYDDDKVKVDIEMEPGLKINYNNKKYSLTYNDDAKDNSYSLALNENPVWDLEFDVGMVDMDFDFSDYKVSKIDINGGLSTIDIKLGDKWDHTYVEIDADASDIVLRIPKDSGCSIDMDSAFTNKNLEGFNKVERNMYQSGNYAYSDNKVFIDIESGLSNITVLRY